MFYKQDQSGFRTLVPGIEMKAFVYGEKSLMAGFHLAKGSLLPRHSHLHEQTGYLVSGRIRLMVGEDTFEATAGDSWSIPGGIEHSAEIIDDSFAIEVFSPAREEYLHLR